MKHVVLESPYSGDTILNIEYARKCLVHSISLGEAPFASHLLYTQPGVLDDNKPEERSLGIKINLAWVAAVDALVVYHDLGISDGMMEAIKHATALGIQIHYRKILYEPSAT